MRTSLEHQEHGGPACQASIDGLVVGRVAGFDPSGNPLVSHDWLTDEPVAARSLCALGADSVGREAALLFEQGDPDRPIVLGLMHQPSVSANDTTNSQPAPPQRELTLDAAERITLRCGKSSITLTKAGKLLLRGAYLLSRSSGVNKIKGGSVQIN